MGINLSRPSDTLRNRSTVRSQGEKGTRGERVDAMVYLVEINEFVALVDKYPTARGVKVYSLVLNFAKVSVGRTLFRGGQRRHFSITLSSDFSSPIALSYLHTDITEGEREGRVGQPRDVQYYRGTCRCSCLHRGILSFIRAKRDIRLFYAKYILVQI